MITSYILVLCFSTWLFAYGLNYVGNRMAHLLKRPGLLPAGISLLLPILLFLVVVAANPAMLVAAILLAVAPFTTHHLPRIARLGLPIIASLLALSKMQVAPVMHIPPFALSVGALILIAGMLLAADRVTPSMQQGGIGILLCLAPLLAAPFMGAPSYIALDIAIIASALLAALMVADRDSSLLLARQPLVLMLGWLVVEAALHGALIPAACSLLLYAALLAYSLSKPNDDALVHAF